MLPSIYQMGKQLRPQGTPFRFPMERPWELASGRTWVTSQTDKSSLFHVQNHKRRISYAFTNVNGRLWTIVFDVLIRIQKQ